MKSSDFKCESCNNIEEIYIEDIESFPLQITCKKCGKKAIRKFSAFGVICHQGKCGNYKNGYTSNSVSIKKT